MNLFTITFDNSNGRQQIITGGQTTHYTTDTIFQVKSANNINNNTEYPENGEILDDYEKADFGEFKIPKKRASPPRIPNSNDEFANVELLNLSLEKHIAWVLLSAVGNNILEENLPSVRIEEIWVALNCRTRTVS